MHKIQKTILLTLIIVLSSLNIFGMQDSQDQGLCSICKKNNATQTKTITKPKTTWNGEWAYQPPNSPTLLSASYGLSNSLGYSNFESPRQSPKHSPRFPTPPRQRYKQPLQTIYIDQCSHTICLECSKASDAFTPDEKGCRLCPYAFAYAEHAQCDINGCENIIKQITQHTKHTHALCNQHICEITKLHTYECKICYAQKNPTILNEYPFCEICANVTDHITVKESCTHHLCTNCTNKSAYINANDGCRLCIYLHARAEHTECDIKTCNNPAEHFSKHAKHTHGLCNKHNTEITKKLHYHIPGCKICYALENTTLVNQSSLCEQCEHKADHITINTSCSHHLCNVHNNESIHFKYSPIEYIKNTLKGNTCTTCFIENNPEITSCVSTRYWGEIALLAAAAGVVIYGAKKIYTWWQERKKQEEEKKHAQSEEMSICS